MKKRKGYKLFTFHDGSVEKIAVPDREPKPDDFSSPQIFYRYHDMWLQDQIDLNDMTQAKNLGAGHRSQEDIDKVAAWDLKRYNEGAKRKVIAAEVEELFGVNRTSYYEYTKKNRN